jgi:NitT/TauT family transport system permease protein
VKRADRPIGETLLRYAAPTVVGLGFLLLWHWAVRHYQVPHYIVPSPKLVFRTLVEDWDILSGSLLFTLRITGLALLFAVAIGVLTAFLFVQSRVIEASFFPYAIFLQVTPIVAIAPLIIIWVKDTVAALVICATIVAIFPVISNTTLGLRSVDSGLFDLFRLYGASRWQILRRLRVPSALPYFFAGLRVAGGLALIGAVVAEFVAGTGGAVSGLAYQILQSGLQLNIPRLFAALFLITVTGIVIFLAITVASRLALRHWHESEITPEQ